MNVVLKLFALQPGRHSPVQALTRLGPLMAKSSHSSFLCFPLSSGNGPARFVAGADTPKPGRSAHHHNATQFKARGGRWFEALAA